MTAELLGYCLDFLHFEMGSGPACTGRLSSFCSLIYILNKMLVFSVG